MDTIPTCPKILPNEIAKQLEEEDIAIQKYKIPDEFLTKIPDNFWEVFARRLYNIFGASIFDKYEDIDARQIDFLTSTTGWAKAFCAACNVVGLNDFCKYYRKLEWYESDQFDDEILENLEEKYINKMEGNK